MTLISEPFFGGWQAINDEYCEDLDSLAYASFPLPIDKDQPQRWSYHEVHTSTLETERLKARGVTFEPYYIKDLVDAIR